MHPDNAAPVGLYNSLGQSIIQPDALRAAWRIASAYFLPLEGAFGYGGRPLPTAPISVNDLYAHLHAHHIRMGYKVGDYSILPGIRPDPDYASSAVLMGQAAGYRGFPVDWEIRGLPHVHVFARVHVPQLSWSFDGTFDSSRDCPDNISVMYGGAQPLADAVGEDQAAEALRTLARVLDAAADTEGYAENYYDTGDFCTSQTMRAGREHTVRSQPADNTVVKDALTTFASVYYTGRSIIPETSNPAVLKFMEDMLRLNRKAQQSRG